MRAICCRIGDAPTSWPVFRSCRLSLEIVAQAKMIATMNSANATRAVRFASDGDIVSARIEANVTIDRIPTPEIGLFDAPISPAMYPQMPAIRNPTTSTTGTASSVSLTALGASTVELAKVYDNQAATSRHAIVRPTIHCGDRS